MELSHEVDYLQWIFGPYDWVSGHNGRASNFSINVEDNATLIMGKGEFGENGQPVTLLAMDFFRLDPTRKCTVIGDKATLLWDGIAGTVSCYTKELKVWNLLMQAKEDLKLTYDREWDAFLAAIEMNQTPSVSIKEGLQVLQIIDAVRAAKNYPVYLKDSI